jgi:hypothetical protein
MTINVQITEVQKGDIVRFKSYWLRVEQEPQRGKGSIRLQGRATLPGAPLVDRWFMGGRRVEVDRT